VEAEDSGDSGVDSAGGGVGGVNDSEEFFFGAVVFSFLTGSVGSNCRIRPKFE